MSLALVSTSIRPGDFSPAYPSRETAQHQEVHEQRQPEHRGAARPWPVTAGHPDDDGDDLVLPPTKRQRLSCAYRGGPGSASASTLSHGALPGSNSALLNSEESESTPSNANRIKRLDDAQWKTRPGPSGLENSILGGHAARTPNHLNTPHTLSSLALAHRSSLAEGKSPDQLPDSSSDDEEIAIPHPSKASPWFKLPRKPYCSVGERDALVRGAGHRLKPADTLPGQRTVYHVDFTAHEISQIKAVIGSHFERQGWKSSAESFNELIQECVARKVHLPLVVGDSVPGRSVSDVWNLCSDILAGRAAAPAAASMLSVARREDKTARPARREGRIPSLMLAREMEGLRGFGRMRRLVNFTNEFRNMQEDRLEVAVEFSNCAGDIATMSWVSDDAFIAGTTTHSDEHNQQYNKPGNLLLCSAPKAVLRGYPDHRIPRPRVEKGDNSTEAMRQSQDPWLYSSVVSSDYDAARDLAFTSSFDKTVKVWKAQGDGSGMGVCATWPHNGNVNFVFGAKDGSGRVATASDVPSEAVRIYTVDEGDLARSPFQAFSCLRQDASADSSGRWAYLPATMQWGRAPGTQHLLAVGYSPRSFTGDDHDIPEDKRKSGEIALWDAGSGRRIPVMTASTANVFEVAWHPTLPIFLAATTPSGIGLETPSARTKIHIFLWDAETGGYSEKQNLECAASDINELAVRPNSARSMYVAAGCTDGNAYVWDTAQGDLPVHVLAHGDPVDAVHGDREREDTGVKFVAWGSSQDRLYTGGSDGKLIAWNVRNHTPRSAKSSPRSLARPLERVLLEAPGPISCGSFSPDLSRLAVGDATGRVFLLSLDGKDRPEPQFITLGGIKREVRRPRPFLAHPDPLPPPPPPPPSSALQSIPRPSSPSSMDVDHQPTRKTTDDTTDDATNVTTSVAAPKDDTASLAHGIAHYAHAKYLATGQLRLVRNPVIGAVQGPAYGATGLFRREAHLDDDPGKQLLPQYERLQLESVASSRGSSPRAMRRLRPVAVAATEAAAVSQQEGAGLAARHAINAAGDLDLGALDAAVLEELVRDGAVLYDDSDEGLVYE